MSHHMHDKHNASYRPLNLFVGDRLTDIATNRTAVTPKKSTHNLSCITFYKICDYSKYCYTFLLSPATREVTLFRG